MQIELLNLSGGTPKATAMWDGSVRVVESHGRYADAVARGNCYAVFDTAGHTVPSGLSTAPINVSIYNPIGSGVFLSLIYANIFYTVVQATVGAVWVGVTPTGSAATTGTALATQNCNGSAGVGKVKGLTTATLPAVPTIIADLGAGLTGAATTIPYLPGLFRFFDGLVGVGPGGALSFQMSQAGPATGAWGGWIWEEVPMSGAGPALVA